MSVVIFVGPTLTADAVAQCLDPVILPPVRQGDVYRVARDRPRAIGIIDGFFEGVPSVWHKEILWAMNQGIPVYGSASMGALRAAELADFGMIGVGRIFEDFYSRTLQDDDEVAVLHSPAELGYLPLSEPMVSVRATVEEAQNLGMLVAERAAEVLRIAKGMNYRQRSWPNIIDALNGLSDIQSFVDWLPNGKVDAKARDAIEMLGRMAEDLANDLPFPATQQPTEETLMWKGLRARVDADQKADQAVIDEVRLNPDMYTRLRERAALTLLAREEADRRDEEPDRPALMAQMDAHRQKAGLSRRAALMAWLDENDLSVEEYEAMLADAARVHGHITSRASVLESSLLRELRRDGSYAELRDRAHRKAQRGAESLTARGGPASGRLPMVMWYFETQLDQPVPDDLESYAVSLGLAGREAFFDLIEAEYLFCHADAGLNSTVD